MNAIMVGAATCRQCQQAKELFQKRGHWPRIDYVDLDSDRGRRLAEQFGQERAPFYVLDGKAIVYTGEFLRELEEREESGRQ